MHLSGEGGGRAKGRDLTFFNTPLGPAGQKKKTFFAFPYKNSFAYISSIFRQSALLGLNNKISNAIFLMNVTLRNKALFFRRGDILISKILTFS